MRTSRLKSKLTKALVTFLLIAPVLTAHVTSAQASLEPLIFSEDADIVKFTHMLILANLRSERRGSFYKNKNKKKHTGSARPAIEINVKHFVID